MKGDLFSPRLLVIASVVTAISLATALGLAVFGAPGVPVTAAPDGFSPSAVGHLAFCRFLERLGIEVVRSRHRTAERAPPSALLVIAEPVLEAGDPTRPAALEAMLAREGPVFVVCPKWEVSTDPDHPGWISAARLLPLALAQQVLETIAHDLRILRPARPLEGWHGPGLEATPTLPDDPQLLAAGTHVEPLLATAQGILLARVHRRDGTTVHVLSDPDLLSAQGLARGENALLLARFVEALRPEGGAVVLDETLHGHELVPSLWRELLTWPLVVPVGLALLAALVLGWLGATRFGAPLPAPAGLGSGKGFLVETTADLLRSGGHADHALGRYFAWTVREVTRATHVPPGLEASARRDWLERVGEGRRITRPLALLREDVRSASRGGSRGLLEVASRVHAWRKEMTDGSRDDS